MFKKITLILMLTGIQNSTVSARDNEIKAVETAIEALRKAMVDADSAMLSSLTSEGLTYGHSNGKVESKAEFIDTITSGKSHFVTIELAHPYIEIHGNTAVARHEFTADTNDGGKPGKVHLHILWVWHEEDGGWKLLARQAVRI